eukprot:2178749-Pleurochrysis_carterae.AAC.3
MCAPAQDLSGRCARRGSWSIRIRSQPGLPVWLSLGRGPLSALNRPMPSSAPVVSTGRLGVHRAGTIRG